MTSSELFIILIGVAIIAVIVVLSFAFVRRDDILASVDKYFFEDWNLWLERDIHAPLDAVQRTIIRKFLNICKEHNLTPRKAIFDIKFANYVGMNKSRGDLSLLALLKQEVQKPGPYRHLTDISDELIAKNRLEAGQRQNLYDAEYQIAAEHAKDTLDAFISHTFTISTPEDGSIIFGEVPFILILRNAHQLIADFIYFLTTTKIERKTVIVNLSDYTTTIKQEFAYLAAPEIFKNLAINADPKSDDDYLKPAQSKLAPLALAQLCFKNTPYLEIFKTPVPLAILAQQRVEHCHVLGRTGHGKSTALFHIAYEDIVREQPCSLIVIEPKGSLVHDIAYLEQFSRTDRLTIIDPRYTPAFNFFALPDRLKAQPSNQRRQVVANIISQYAQALSALDAETSINQKTLLAYVVELVFAMNGTLWDFLRILEDPARDYEKSMIVPNLMQHLKSQDRDYFEHQFYGGTVPVSRRSLAMKIRFLMKSAPQFESMFGAKENKIDLFQQMQTAGSVTLINTSEGTLTSDASSFFGRLMLGQIMTGALERQASRDIPHPVYVIVDEAHLYIDQTIEKFLLQTRSAKVGITLAHQQLKDLHAARDTVLTQPAIKIAAPSPEDADAMARNMRVTEPDLFDNLSTGQFAVYVRGMPSAIKISVPDTIRTAPKMSADEYRALIDCNYHRFQDTPTEPLTITQPEPIAEPIPTPTTKPSRKPVAFKADRNGHVYLDVYVNRIKIRMLVDTGATNISFSPADAIKLGFYPENLVYSHQVNTASGIAYDAQITVQTLRLDTFELRDIQAFASKDGTTSLLGQDFLRRLDGYDMRNGFLTFTFPDARNGATPHTPPPPTDTGGKIVLPDDDV